MFINLSNHPSSKWSTQQRDAAIAMGGDIVDMAFPNVPPTATPQEIGYMAEEIVTKIGYMVEDCVSPVVMVQGEPTLTYAIVARIDSWLSGVTAVAACTERKSVEKVQEDGSVLKTSVFEFVQFRSYL